MKRIYVASLLLICLGTTYGQKIVPKSHSVITPGNTSSLRAPTDTLWGKFDQWTSAYFTPLDTGGYLTGNNGYGDIQKAQVFQIQNKFIVEKCILWFGAKKLESSNQNSKVNIYVMSVGGQGTNAQGPTTNTAPDSILANTTLLATAIDTNQGTWNIVTFQTPPTVTGNFAVSVDFSSLSPGDTASLIHSQDGQGTMFNDLSWEQQSDSSWVSFGWAGANGWGIDIQLGIFVIGEEILGLDEAGNTAFKLYPPFPNPNNGIGNIFLELKEPTEVIIELMDITGKIVSNLNEGIKPAGKSMITINTKELKNGTYFYRVKIKDQVVVKKLVVSKQL